MLLVALAFAQSSPDTARWAADARRQIHTSWGACVDNLGGGVALPAPVYTTVAEAEINADGTFATARITSPSGSPELDDCALRAVRTSGRFPVPPPAMVATGGTAKLSEIVLTLKLASTPPPPPVDGPLVEAARVPGVTAADVAKGATRIASLPGGARNIWCRGPEPTCDIRDARGSMLVFSITTCNAGEDVRFATAYGPMVVRGGAEVLPGVKACE